MFGRGFLEEDQFAFDARRYSGCTELGLELISKYERLGDIHDLDEAILFFREAFSLCPPGHSDCPTSLGNLANALSSRYEQCGGSGDLKEAILLDREALSFCPPGHSGRPQALINLANHLAHRCDQLGNINDLNEAIILGRESLSLRSSGHIDPSLSLNNLAYSLFSRYEQLGMIEDLNETILLGREALSLRLHGHPRRSTTSNNLASRLFSRYEQLGAIDDLNEAIVLDREALSLRPPGNPKRSSSLMNLSHFLSSRYDMLGGIDDLKEAILLIQEGFSLYPPGHPYRLKALNSAVGGLLSVYRKLGRVDDLNKAITFAKEALSLCAPGHPSRPSSLMNLAVLLSAQYHQLGRIDVLNEAILLDQEGLSLSPPEHPLHSSYLGNFAGHLFSRYNQLGGIDDLNKAILLYQEDLSLLPLGYPSRSKSLEVLAVALSSRYRQLVRTGNHNAATKDKQELFRLFTELIHATPSRDDLSAASTWVKTAEEFHHDTTVLAYETALRLLVENRAILPPFPQHLTRLKSVPSFLAVDAFSACLRNQSPTKAVELLEQGRAVFWNQLTRLHSPLDSVIASGPEGKVMADEFTRLASLIRMAIQSPGAGQHDRVCDLNIKLQKVVSKIRELYDHSRFLLPLRFSDLRHAASDGPVIIVNTSHYTSDALVVFADKDPVHIPLSVTQKDVRDLASKLGDLTRLSKGMDASSMSREFMSFLRELWDRVVSHIIGFLQTVCQPNSRIWWCPTAEFSLLPLHAASPFRNGQKGVSQLYVSSYTPTLSALIRARRPNPLEGMAGKKRFIAVGQASAQGERELHSVGTELANIGRLVDGAAIYTHIEGEESCISRVVDELGKNEWVHFACHGIPNKTELFESAFALHDGRFTIERIIQCKTGNPEFAYLSACHTTVGDQEAPDEIIHLASAMQFSGFRSVIGTMWAVDDAETNKVTSMFYSLMKDESGHLDHTRAARALRTTMRKVDVPMDQRILYVHIGA